MAEVIRRIEEKDFNAVSALYNGKNSVEELKWLYTSQIDPKIYNAFVAVNNNRIIGVIGYSQTIHIYNYVRISTVIPMSWKLSQTYKGMAGILLMKKVLEQEKFGLIVGGTKIAQKLYPIFKYKNSSKIDTYYKILNLKDQSTLLKKRKFVTKLNMIVSLLPSYFSKTSEKNIHKDINLKRYDGDNFIEDKKYNNILKMEITKNYLNWLLSSPTIEFHAFIISYNNNNLGMCILSINYINNKKTGKIVHLPFLGFGDKVWISVLEKCLSFFKKESCSMVSGLAHHKMSHIGLIKTGFVKLDSHQKPLYLKNSKQNLISISLPNWHLQYSEGDQVLLNF